MFTPEQQAEWQNALIVHLQQGNSLSAFVREHPQGPSLHQWFAWRRASDDFASSYMLAREDGADMLADELCAIADSVKDATRDDNAKVQAARLMVDARKWAASKLKPKSYADRVDQGLHITGTIDVKHRITDDDRAKALASIMARQAASNAPNMLEAQRLIEQGPVIDVEPNKLANADGNGQET